MDYPLELDVFDLCSDDLRKQLEGPRLVWFLNSHLRFLKKKLIDSLELMIFLIPFIEI